MVAGIDAQTEIGDGCGTTADCLTTLVTMALKTAVALIEEVERIAEDHQRNSARQERRVVLWKEKAAQ